LKTTIIDSNNNFIEMIMKPAFLVDIPTSINQLDFDEKDVFKIDAYPNPFNSNINIDINLAMESITEISLHIYNLLGQKIKTLYNGKLNKGTTNFKWVTLKKHLSTGIYFIVLKGGDKVFITKKIILIK